MRKIHLFLFAVLCFQCKDESPPIGEPFSQVEGINDTWKLVSIEQTDELNKGDDEALDVTTLMGGAEAAVMTFNSTDFTYTLESGTMRSFFPANGNWFFDDNDFPAKITLENSGTQVELDLQAPIRRESGEDNLIIKYIRPIDGCKELEGGQIGAVAYRYNFLRQ